MFKWAMPFFLFDGLGFKRIKIAKLKLYNDQKTIVQNKKIKRVSLEK